MEKIIKKNKLYESGNLRCKVEAKKKNFDIVDENGNKVALIRTYKNSDMQRVPSTILKINDSLYNPEFDKTTNQQIMKIFSDISRENNLRVTTICTGKGNLGLVDDYIYHYPMDDKYTKTYVSEELPANIKGEYFLISNNKESTPFIVSEEQRDLMNEHNIDIYAFAPKFIPYSTKENVQDTIVPYLQRHGCRDNHIVLNNPEDMKNSTLFDDYRYLSKLSHYDLFLSNNYEMGEKQPITLPVLKTDHESDLHQLRINAFEIRSKENPYKKIGGREEMMRNGVFDFSKNHESNIDGIDFGYLENCRYLDNHEKDCLKNVSDSLKTLKDNSSIIFSNVDVRNDFLSNKMNKEEFLEKLNRKEISAEPK